MKMMLNTGTKQVNSLQCMQITFDKYDVVSMKALCVIDNELQESTLLFSFTLLNDLMRLSGKVGEIIQQEVCNKLWSNEPQPYIINYAQHDIFITTCALQVSTLIAYDTSCYSVESVLPLSILQQTKNLRINLKYFPGANISQQHTNNVFMVEIAKMYSYYAGLIDLNIHEQAAREKAGLQNDNLFKIAYCAAKQLKTITEE